MATGGRGGGGGRGGSFRDSSAAAWPGVAASLLLGGERQSPGRTEGEPAGGPFQGNLQRIPKLSAISLNSVPL